MKISKTAKVEFCHFFAKKSRQIEVMQNVNKLSRFFSVQNLLGHPVSFNLPYGKDGIDASAPGTVNGITEGGCSPWF